MHRNGRPGLLSKPVAPKLRAGIIDVLMSKSERRLLPFPDCSIKYTTRRDQAQARFRKSETVDDCPNFYAGGCAATVAIWNATITPRPKDPTVAGSLDTIGLVSCQICKACRTIFLILPTMSRSIRQAYQIINGNLAMARLLRKKTLFMFIPGKENM